MSFEVVFTSEADTVAKTHLLQHCRRGEMQEDLCFALWRPSTGQMRRVALIDEIILPEKDERILHGNVSFEPAYLTRVVRIAREKKAGMVFMHSHLSPGWQGMSTPDVEAERDVLAFPAGATGLPLVGLTIGTDGYWSARFWEKDGQMRRRWCEKVRVVGPRSYTIYFNDKLVSPPERREILRRTFDTWGQEVQQTISRLKVGIVGLGSVGCIVAEAIARIGVTQAVLIDPDKVEKHNLDRLLYGTIKDVGKLKVTLAKQAMQRNATAEKMKVTPLPVSIHDEFAYRTALDCDVIFSCVDRPVARDVLNYIAQAHLIPVIDGGVAVEVDKKSARLSSAHWRAHVVTPYHRCLRCNGQYDTSQVVMELDGSLDDPSYVSNLPAEEQGGNQNVFPFSLSVAGMEINLMLRYLLAADWWLVVQQQDCQFLTGKTSIINAKCHPNCEFWQRRARGDAEAPSYLVKTTVAKAGGLTKFNGCAVWQRAVKLLGKICQNA